jgi:hypothetical protein
VASSDIPASPEGGFFGWEYYGWHKYFETIESHNRGGHTSILWENMRFAMTPDLLGRRGFVAVKLFAFLIGIGVGIASDVAFIAVKRRILRWGSGLKSFFQIASIVIANLLLALISAFGPASLSDSAYFQ